ncbi:16S rRNA (guanine(527)-N(7))-methyltransferase RsmG [Candidatus Poribacteria bacterium]|nr:16S rRNA (guanine(527)-N(7))-methyltransferase RsmG [Candidatus Poribacteria bacterium]
MDKTDFYSYFQEGLKKSSLSLTLNTNTLFNFHSYLEILQDYNQKINLTSIVMPEKIIEKHFIESLMLYPYLYYIFKDDSNDFKDKDLKSLQNKQILDIGTGAGFPGMPLKIILPDTKFVLIESIKKKANFLEEVKKQLKLELLEILPDRAEDLGQNSSYREKLDIVVSRAVGTLSFLIELSLPFLKTQGIAIFPKGMEIDIELSEAKKALKALNGEIALIDKYRLPHNQQLGQVVIIRKKTNTPSCFPRKMPKVGKF